MQKKNENNNDNKIIENVYYNGTLCVQIQYIIIICIYADDDDISLMSFNGSFLLYVWLSIRFAIANIARIFFFFSCSYEKIYFNLIRACIISLN